MIGDSQSYTKLSGKLLMKYLRLEV